MFSQKQQPPSTVFHIHHLIQSNKHMNRKKQAQTELSYYGLYLLNHLRENRFPQASDADFIRERADHAAEVYEQARRSDLFADAAQELAMSALLKGLHLSKYNILHDVVDNEFPLETSCLWLTTCIPSTTSPTTALPSRRITTSSIRS